MQNVSSHDAVLVHAHGAFMAYVRLLTQLCNSGCGVAVDGVPRDVLEKTVEWSNTVCGVSERSVCAGVRVSDFESCVGGCVGSGSVVDHSSGGSRENATKVCSGESGVDRQFGLPRVVESGSGDLRGSESCVADSVGVVVDNSVVRESTLRNREKRRLRKQRKLRRKGIDLQEASSSPVAIRSGRGFFSECSLDVQSKLRESRAELLVEQNKLALLKAKRGLKVLEDSDVNEEVRRYRTGVRASTEKNMVSIEKTHATLKATGNVPGFAETVVSDGGILTPELIADGVGDCSITPDSSASQAEFRACQKALLDSEKRNVELEEALKKFGVTLSMSKNMDKETFTDDTVGNDLFAEFYPNGEVVHYVDRGGKKKFKVGEEYVVHDFEKMKETMGDEAWKEFLKT